MPPPPPPQDEEIADYRDTRSSKKYINIGDSEVRLNSALRMQRHKRGVNFYYMIMEKIRSKSIWESL